MREIDAVVALLNERRNDAASFEERRLAMEAFGAALPLAEGMSVSQVDLGRPAELHQGPEVSPDRVLLYLHGGGFCIGSPGTHRGLISHLAHAAKAQIYALDYRLAPQHPFPAAVEDVEAAVGRLLDGGLAPDRLVLAGDSAGAGLALTTALRRRDAGAPNICALYLISPWLDLSLSGQSMTLRAGHDPMLSRKLLTDFADAYLHGADARDRGASPLWANLSGLPPTLVQVGANEVLLDDARRFQDRAEEAGAPTVLEVWPAMIHVWHIFYPMLTQAREALEDAGGWLQRRWAQS